MRNSRIAHLLGYLAIVLCLSASSMSFALPLASDSSVTDSDVPSQVAAWFTTKGTQLVRSMAGNTLERARKLDAQSIVLASPHRVYEWKQGLVPETDPAEAVLPTRGWVAAVLANNLVLGVVSVKRDESGTDLALNKIIDDPRMGQLIQAASRKIRVVKDRDDWYGIEGSQVSPLSKGAFSFLAGAVPLESFLSVKFDGRQDGIATNSELNGKYGSISPVWWAVIVLGAIAVFLVALVLWRALKTAALAKEKEENFVKKEAENEVSGD